MKIFLSSSGTSSLVLLLLLIGIHDARARRTSACTSSPIISSSPSSSSSSPSTSNDRHQKFDVRRRSGIVALVPTSSLKSRLHSLNRITNTNSKVNVSCLDSIQKFKSGNGKNNSKSILLSTNRGGGGNDQKKTQTPASTKKSNSNVAKKVAYAIILSSAITLIALNKDAITSFNFKEELATQLDILSSKGTKGLLFYIFAFMLWELLVGITTPVETAAGMAFGMKNGVIANAIGKTSGAICAFLLGRYVLRDYVTDKLKDNEYMDLVKDSIEKKPVRVALIWRFSPLPEQIKNFGLAILPVKTWQFTLAVLSHGFPFTLLWTFMGNEMGLLVKGLVDGPSKVLKILMAGVYVLGFFVSPSLVGLWVKGLRDEKMKRDGKTKKNS